ncbi:MAG TPA: hypothetical protein P5559_08315, partial [Candidatus Limiplasma sp.]|nr:hypothetical protein [Candidatus Limiplasma sp.]
VLGEVFKGLEDTLREQLGKAQEALTMTGPQHLTGSDLRRILPHVGRSAVIGTVIGALIMGILNNGMNIIGMDSNVQRLVKGLVLLAAVAFDVMSQGHVALPSFLRFGKNKPEKVVAG